MAHILDFLVYLQNIYVHMEKKKLPDLQITELFIVKCGEDWQHTFMATIIREMTIDGKEIIRGSVMINEGKAWSLAYTEDELGKYLDEMCIMKLDHNLHSSAGVTIQIFGEDLFLN